MSIEKIYGGVLMGNGKTVRRDKVFFFSIAVFALVIAVMRAVNIIIYLPDILDGISSEFFNVVLFVRSLFVTLAYAFGIAFTVGAAKLSCRSGIAAAFCFSLVILADRTFCFIWDLATEAILFGEKNTVLNAVLWLSVDCLFFGILFFASVYITIMIDKRKMYEKSGIPLLEIVLSSAVLTFLELLSKVIICIQFMIEYDDVTVTEYMQMAGDILLVILRYGFFMSAVSIFMYRILDKLAKKDDKRIKM